MKRVICVLPLLLASMSPALANSDTMKISTVKNMYSKAIKESRSGQNEETLDTLFKYADKGLQNAIGISKINRVDEDGYLTYCFEEAYVTLHLSPVNGYALHETKNISYKILKNGKVRASMKYTGNENINSPKFLEYKDFSLQCTGNSCKVTAVSDSRGYSGKLKAEKLCR